MAKYDLSQDDIKDIIEAITSRFDSMGDNDVWCPRDPNGYKCKPFEGLLYCSNCWQHWFNKRKDDENESH